MRSSVKMGEHVLAAIARAEEKAVEDPPGRQRPGRADDTTTGCWSPGATIRRTRMLPRAGTRRRGRMFADVIRDWMQHGSRQTPGGRETSRDAARNGRKRPRRNEPPPRKPGVCTSAETVLRDNVIEERDTRRGRAGTGQYRNWTLTMHTAAWGAWEEEAKEEDGTKGPGPGNDENPGPILP